MLRLIHSFDVCYNNVRDYYNSFTDKWKDLNSYLIYCVQFGEEKYIHALENYGKNFYYLVDDENPNYIIGCGKITDYGDNIDTGNISYGIRPNERNKGYGTSLLKLLLLKCEELGMNKVSVSCKIDNIASKHVILNNNGKLEKEFYDSFEGYGLKYYIKLKPKFSNKIRYLIKKNITNYK